MTLKFLVPISIAIALTGCASPSGVYQNPTQNLRALSMKEVRGYATEIQLFFDRNLENLKAVLSCAEKAAKIRKSEERAKTNLLTKQKFSFDSNGKLANCESRNPEQCEIFIVEGDSAGGSAKSARNRMYQAILPIRGKILNVEKATIDKVLANAEIKTMINAFGCGFSEGLVMTLILLNCGMIKLLLWQMRT